MRRACLCSYHKAINGNGERLSAGMTGPGLGVLVRDHSQVEVLSIVWMQTTFLFCFKERGHSRSIHLKWSSWIQDITCFLCRNNDSFWKEAKHPAISSMSGFCNAPAKTMTLKTQRIKMPYKGYRVSSTRTAQNPMTSVRPASQSNSARSSWHFTAYKSTCSRRWGKEYSSNSE